MAQDHLNGLNGAGSPVWRRITRVVPDHLSGAGSPVWCRITSVVPDHLNAAGLPQWCWITSMAPNHLSGAGLPQWYRITSMAPNQLCTFISYEFETQITKSEVTLSWLTVLWCVNANVKERKSTSRRIRTCCKKTHLRLAFGPQLSTAQNNRVIDSSLFRYPFHPRVTAVKFPVILPKVQVARHS